MNLGPAAEQFLNGKVTVVRLPEFEGPPRPGAPVLKRLHLAQGELAQIWSSDEGLRYVAVVELVPGSIRGNHYHDRKVELVYVITGQVLMVVEDVSTGARAEIELGAGSLIRIETGIAHAIVPRQAGYGVEFSPVEYDAQDVHPQSLTRTEH